MNVQLNKTVSTRVVVYSLLAVFAVYAIFFGPRAVQSRNMKRAGSISDKIKAYLDHDESFSDLRILYSTGNLGRNIRIMGSVPNEAKLRLLKAFVNAECQDEVIHVGLQVRVRPKETTDNMVVH
jgi:hypothetical protein